MRLFRITLYLSEFWCLEIIIKSQKLSRKKDKLGVKFVYSFCPLCSRIKTDRGIF